MTKSYMNCISAHPTPLPTNPRDSGPEITFSAQHRKKTRRFLIFYPKTNEVHFFSTFLNPTSPHRLPEKGQKLVFMWLQGDFQVPLNSLTGVKTA